MLERFGVETVAEASRELQDYSERPRGHGVTDHELPDRLRALR